MRKRGRVNPSNGGCWFCWSDKGEMYLDTEFDTYVHEKCVIEAYNDLNPEARIMIHEFRKSNPNWGKEKKSFIKSQILNDPLILFIIFFVVIFVYSTLFN